MGRVVAGIADPVARLPAGDPGPDRDHPTGRAVPGPEGELPVGHLRVFEPLVRAGVDGQLGAGADGTRLAFDQDLVWSRIRQTGVPDLDLERLDDDGLACSHGSAIVREF